MTVFYFTISLLCLPSSCPLSSAFPSARPIISPLSHMHRNTDRVRTIRITSYSGVCGRRQLNDGLALGENSFSVSTKGSQTETGQRLREQTLARSPGFSQTCGCLCGRGPCEGFPENIDFLSSRAIETVVETATVSWCGEWMTMNGFSLGFEAGRGVAEDGGRKGG
jgi:hypothetical protein